MDVHRHINHSSEDTIRFGRYRLLDVLGEGGMAVVYRALMEGPDGFSKRVALKLIHGDVSSESYLASQFVSEARLGGVLSHPNIVEILDYGKVQGRFYLAMELVDGPTLAQVVRYQQHIRAWLPTEIVLEIVAQVCRGLGYAHAAAGLDGKPLNLVHRDLKPSNVLVNMHGVVKVADFGVARAETNVLRTVTRRYVKGTGPYMSPEQAWGRPNLDHRSDLFAAGILLFELLALDYLYDGRTVEVALRQAQDADVASRFDRIPAIPERDAVLTLLSRSLARRPEDRFQSGEAMADALDALRARLPRGTSLRRWLRGLGPDWRTLPGFDAEPTKILFPPAGGVEASDADAPATPGPAPDDTQTVQVQSFAETPVAGKIAHVSSPGDGAPPARDEDRPVQTWARATRSQVSPARFGLRVGLLAACVVLLALAGWWVVGRQAPVPGATPRPSIQVAGNAPTPADGVSARTAVPATGGTPGPGAVADSGATPVVDGPADGPADGSDEGRRGTLPAKVVSAGGGGGVPTKKRSPAAAPSGPTGDGARPAVDGVARGVGTGVLSLNSRPRSRIMLDQVPLKGFPIRERSVPAGEHTVVFTGEKGHQLMHHLFIRSGARMTCIALFSQGKVVCRELDGG